MSSPVLTRSTRSVVITGASTGIGRATALRLAADGWQVFAGVRRPGDAPTATDPAWSLTGLELDVTDPVSVRRAREQVTAHLQGRPLTALINNAGVGIVAPMQTVDPAELQAVWEVNVLGAVRVTQAFLPSTAAGSRILFVGSVGDRLTVPFAGPLTSSKWALAAIAETFRLELAGQGIAVTIIEPGSINSEAVTKTENAAAVTAEQLSRTDPELAERFGRAMRVAMARERHGSEPAVVAAAMASTLDARRPRTRVLVGRHARLLATVAALLPDPALDRVRLRLFR